MKKIHDPYTEIADEFNRNGVAYIVIGMSGINYYAQGARDTFATQDYDIFIKPTIANVTKAVSILRRHKYGLAADEKKLEENSIRYIVKNRKTILATDPYGITLELILAVSGYTFNQMEIGATIFNVNDVPIRVAKLKKLLTSKKIAGRKKDKLFLKRYEILLKEKTVTQINYLL